MWARARVDALLRQIALTGETKDAIDEIIALSKKYKFVTPYTSFLAAPRSLLRPRVIKPGDPVLRVRTDESLGGRFAKPHVAAVKYASYIAVGGEPAMPRGYARRSSIRIARFDGWNRSA